MHTHQQLLAELRVETSGLPIYAQIRDQLLRVLGRGSLATGDRMPTMRQVAVALKVDLNTVRRAYDELERIGAIVLIRGRGSFVASPEAALAYAEQTLATAAAQGIDPGALVRHLARLVNHKE
jgi:GntR family transcriptional regulator